MALYSVSIDNLVPYETKCNTVTEVLDDATPRDSRSRLSLYKFLGQKITRSGMVKMWSDPRYYDWDNFEHEWVKRNPEED